MKKILILLWLVSTLRTYAAEPNLIVEHYGVEQGLPNNIVNCSLKGKDGFLWFGTWYGLCSFDGTRFKIYNNRDGAYSDIPPRKIESIVEDRNGFLWIKTVDRKLYVFNKQLESFHAVYDDMKNYSGNTQIIKIQRTPEGKVLLLTKDKNLLQAYITPDCKVKIQLLHDSSRDIVVHDSQLKHNVLAETAGSLSWIGQDYHIFTHCKGEGMKDKPADFIHRNMGMAAFDGFTCAYETSGFVWLGDKNGVVYSINLQSGTVNKYELPGITGPVQNILIVPAGIAYITVQGQGVYEYNLGYKTLAKLPVDFQSAHITYSLADKYDKLWFVADNHHLVYYDPLNKTSRQFPFEPGPAISTFQYQDAGELGIFFLTPAGEILMFDRENQEMTSMRTLKPFSDIMEDQLFFDQMIDENDNLWLTSTATGVYRVNFPRKQFHLLKPQRLEDTSVNLDDRGVRALLQAKDGDIWIGTRWSELYRLNNKGEVKQVIAPDKFPIDNVYHIMEDRLGNLWFSTKGNGLIKAETDILSPKGYRFTRYTNDANRSSSISHNDIYFTYQDSKGRIWAGSMGGGLNLLDTEGGEISFKHKYNGFKHYPPYGLYMEVRTIVEDRNGRIWVGTTDGLMSFDGNFNSPEDIIFETYRKENASSNIADNDIYALYKDSEQQIWVSVFGGGLNKLVDYDEATRKPVFQTYGMREGLNTDVIVSIVEDDRQKLWLATESGLSSFDKKTKHFRNYDKYDGFLNVRMEEGSAIRTINNELWIGCKEGILTFDPHKLESSDTNNLTYIVDFKISNKDLRNFKDQPGFEKSIKFTQSITLNHDQSMFTLEFAALNFLNSNRISYRYILEGYEKEWHYNGKNRIASYTNVPAGKYLFRVQSVDEAAPDTLSERVLQIVILPPWWRSWWAYLIYIALGAALSYLIIRIGLLFVKMKNNVYIEQKVSELKIKFFTSISHELRTPLTIIKGPIQELKEGETLSPKGRQYVDLMEKSTNQMLQLVNQILDFRKIQNGKMRLHVSQINLNDITRLLYKEFEVLAQENDIRYSGRYADTPVTVWADNEKLGIVIRNILSNAFKFTPEGGSIAVTTGQGADGQCYIRIADTGIGIDEKRLHEIFERFAQGENNPNTYYYQGTGIGLALSKEIMHLHHGSIDVKSQRGKGSAFTIRLQPGKEHYKPGEVDFYLDDSEDTRDEKKVEPDTAVADEKPSDASLPSILVVEDNKNMSAMIKLQLDDRYNIYTALNGTEGLKRIHLNHPDVVITDQMMPEMDGLEMLQHIRKDFQISHIPVIILTSKNDDETRTNAINLGANAYITKPFSKEYLVARIEQLLRERKLFRERVWQQQKNGDADDSSYEQHLVKKDVQFLDKINKVIEENMDDSDFNIDAIATNVGLSRSAFFKKLKSLTGLAPVDLVKEVRLNKSVELLKTTHMSISEIAYAVGFKDSGYYSKCFRKKYGQTPKEYLNELRKG